MKGETYKGTFWIYQIIECFTIAKKKIENSVCRVLATYSDILCASHPMQINARRPEYYSVFFLTLGSPKYPILFGFPWTKSLQPE